MPLRDSSSGYGTFSILNHWMTAIAVVIILGLGLVFHELPRGSERSMLEALHISFGMVAIPVFAIRIAWRLQQGYPDPAPGPRWQQVSAKLMSLLLMGSITVLAITGPLTIWAEGHSISIFDLMTIGSPLPALPGLADTLEEVHEIASDALIVALIIHVAAALKHVFIDRDNTLRRMIRSAA